MQIPIGTYLVHPVHGPTVLVDVIDREVGGEVREYAVLEHVEQDLVLQLPMATLDEHELRPAMKKQQAREVLAVLAEPAGGSTLTWRTMRVRNQAKMTSGEPSQLAEVIRDLRGKREEKGISPSERTMLRRARTRLEAELDLALDRDASEVVAEMLDVEVDA